MPRRRDRRSARGSPKAVTVAGADRFASLGPLAARAGLAALLGLVLLGLIGGAQRFAPGQAPPANDHAIYLRLIDDLHRGESYYPAAVREQRLAGYPLRPFVTVRLPTLAAAMAALPDSGARRLSIEILAVLVVLAWAWRLRDLAERPVSFAVTIFMIAASTVPAFIDYGYTLHELWSGELIALSLALHDARRWPFSLALALLAVSIRELAAPYLMAMAALALWERRPREAGAWILGIVAFGCALAIHAALLRPLIAAGDQASPGWLSLGGWKYLLALLRWNGALLMAPDWAPALIAPVVLLGLSAAKGPLADRLALVVVGYACAFMIVGRPDTAYWGLMIAPLWPVALIWAWSALRGLLARSVARERALDVGRGGP
jgi:hypothetical protein